MSEKEDEFSHISGDNDFQKRSNSIFGCLDGLEPPTKEESEPVSHRGARRPPHVPDHVLHPEKWTKYTLEEDGSDKVRGLKGNDLNKHVAFTFIAELKERKQSEAGRGNEGSGTSRKTEWEDSGSSRITKPEDLKVKSEKEKHTFSKEYVVDKNEVEKEADSSPRVRDGVVIMPEYVVGKNTVKPKKHKHISNLASDEVMENKEHEIGMRHLLDDDGVDTPIENMASGQTDKANCPGGAAINDATSSISGDEQCGETEEKQVKFAKRKHKERRGMRKLLKTDEEG